MDTLTRRPEQPPGPRAPERPTASTAAWSPTTRTRTTRAASGPRSPRCSATWTAAGRCRARRTPATRSASTPCPPSAPACGSSSRPATCRDPIWIGCWWGDGQLPKDETGTAATPDVKIVRSEQGLLLALDDGARRSPSTRCERQQPPQDRGPAGPDHDEGHDQGRGRGAADRAGAERHASARVRRRAADVPEPARDAVQHPHASGRDGGRDHPGDAGAAGRRSSAGHAELALDEGDVG